MWTNELRWMSIQQTKPRFYKNEEKHGWTFRFRHLGRRCWMVTWKHEEPAFVESFTLKAINGFPLTDIIVTQCLVFASRRMLFKNPSSWSVSVWTRNFFLISVAYLLCVCDKILHASDKAVMDSDELVTHHKHCKLPSPVSLAKVPYKKEKAVKLTRESPRVVYTEADEDNVPIVHWKLLIFSCTSATGHEPGSFEVHFCALLIRSSIIHS